VGGFQKKTESYGGVTDYLLQTDEDIIAFSKVRYALKRKIIKVTCEKNSEVLRQ
jgi:hypothetical protein